MLGLHKHNLLAYGEKPREWKPSGKRVKRGLYKSSNGHLINGDANGASNILRKADATPRRRKSQGNAHQEVTTQLNLDLTKVGREALALPLRYRLDSLSKSYRQRVETRLKEDAMPEPGFGISAVRPVS